jgi:Uma2 family endonuclease
MTLPRRYTYTDYLQLPDDQRYEVIGGRLFMTPAPKGRHQTVVSRIAAILWHFVIGAGLGKVMVAPYDVLLSEHDVVQPDILFISKERLSMYDEEGPLRGAPDLVIEVLSPSTAQRDRVEKRALYARSGVRVYWLVDPEDRSITRISFPTEDEITYRLGDTLAELVLPGFALPVEELIHLD